MFTADEPIAGIDANGWGPGYEREVGMRHRTGADMVDLLVVENRPAFWGA
jgi:hypothetical protein